ncbi:hypothetical protein MPTK1_3g07500 [Marchantia polymorpha subsp. ruderalis]|uniref:Uncharacterized protein n=2 Tax=Marchantia polymorpha TaxID=3197 RepID=A0AAF6AYD9_MARPO|nr:hypothetical protein MARPO_0006s0225 [Marchantia polymorpha]BBN04773.1 hypothetical protein Mp_3g07500 [Marchantia polymorpha subsp. ruderalis]|eukprot:PTQ48219.1 hypothetical protein MARPO_0006s0225 [Marchantia polymorpha]
MNFLRFLGDAHGWMTTLWSIRRRQHCRAFAILTDALLRYRDWNEVLPMAFFLGRGRNLIGMADSLRCQPASSFASLPWFRGSTSMTAFTLYIGNRSQSNFVETSPSAFCCQRQLLPLHASHTIESSIYPHIHQ